MSPFSQEEVVLGATMAHSTVLQESGSRYAFLTFLCPGTSLDSSKSQPDLLTLLALGVRS